MKKVVIASVVSLILLIAVGLGLAQQKHKLTYTLPAEASKYTIQHTIEVGDIPGHKIRVAELHRVFPTDKPIKFEGIRVVETYERFFSDYINFSGHHWGYGIELMENGDKIYYKFDGTTHTTFLPDGSTMGTYSGTSIYTGGTGKFKGIRGTAKYTGMWAPKEGLNEVTNEIEYWME
jgi:hypothetical protein